jgi:RNA polymerase sigma-70 factor (ECF subfamily)
VEWTEESFREQFDALYPSLTRYLWSLVGDAELAHDVAQEALLRLYTRAPDDLEPEACRFWTLRTARNLCINEMRRRERFRRIRSWLGRTTPRSAAGPHEEHERRERAELQLDILRELPESKRSALLLREQEGLRYTEIAEVLGVSESKVKVDIHRARTRVRERWTAADRAAHRRDRSG